MVDKVFFFFDAGHFCNLPRDYILQQITFFPLMQFRKREFFFFCQVTLVIKKDQRKVKKRLAKKVVLPANNNNKSQCTFALVTNICICLF